MLVAKTSSFGPKNILSQRKKAFYRRTRRQRSVQIVPSSDDKSAKKISTVPKTVQFLKSNDGTDNGTKKVPRYSTVVQKYRGTALLCFYDLPSSVGHNSWASEFKLKWSVMLQVMQKIIVKLRWGSFIENCWSVLSLITSCVPPAINQHLFKNRISKLEQKLLEKKQFKISSLTFNGVYIT